MPFMLAATTIHLPLPSHVDKLGQAANFMYAFLCNFKVRYVLIPILGTKPFHNTAHASDGVQKSSIWIA